MAALFRFLASLLAHVFWHRSGRRGPLPPLRIPGKRTTHLPIPSPWQIMAASWAIERLWKAYGPTVKRRLNENPSPLANKIGDLLPGPEQVAPASNSAPNPATTTAATTTPTKSGATTQLLPQNPPDDAALPSGSVLRSLRPSH